MNKEMRARSVHPSRHYGYTHHDAHAALLSASMRRLSKRLRPCSGRQAALRSRRASRCVPDRPGSSRPFRDPRSRRGRRVRPRHGTVRRDTDLRVGSISRSTRVSRASFLATIAGCRAPGAVFRVFARSRRRPAELPCGASFSHGPLLSRRRVPSRRVRALVLPSSCFLPAPFGVGTAWSWLARLPSSVAPAQPGEIERNLAAHAIVVRRFSPRRPLPGLRSRCSGCSRGSYARAASSRRVPPSRVLLASPAPRSLAFAPPPRAADVSCALSLVPVAPALRHGLNSAPCPRVLGPLRSSCGCIRHVRQERSSGWLEVPRRSRSAGDRTRPDSTRRHAEWEMGR